MTSSYDKLTAVVVLPPVGGRLRDKGLHNWLARADLARVDGPVELLASVLGELGIQCPDEGLAALRIWGQTGDRPTVWIAGADPVYLEPRLDRLCLHELRRQAIPPADLRPLMDHLQRTLSSDGDVGFARVGSYAYVTSQEPMASAKLPAYAIDQLEPDDFLPVGGDVRKHRQLSSEIEMALHEHEVNNQRQKDGLQPVNGLWIWGGGRAPEQVTEPHPPLFSDDPLLRGYWASKTGVTEYWPGNISTCLDLAVAGFVAVTPEFDDDVEVLEACLGELRQALQSRRLNKLILLFRDGIYADVRRSQALRIWRRGHPFIDATGGEP